ncbi:hypothetical protein FACS1894133_4390 [Clostridia bacterium]|nr:hypothetical protein FACS1894133_4390 [Clostridia bacterium]
MREISLVNGDPGSGKTTLILAVIADITRGRAIDGGEFIAPPAEVIFQTTENSFEGVILPRLDQLGADSMRVNRIEEDGVPLSLMDARIEEAIIQTGAKMFCADPIQGFVGGISLNTANSVRPIMTHLAGVAERTDCAIVLIGHLNKNGGKSLYRGLGSIDLTASARSVLTVGRVPDDDNMRAVVVTKSNNTTPGASYAFEIDPVNGFKWYGEYDITVEEILNGKSSETEKISRLDEACNLFREILADGAVPSKEVSDTAKALGIADKTFNRAKVILGVKSIGLGTRWEMSL